MQKPTHREHSRSCLRKCTGCMLSICISCGGLDFDQIDSWSARGLRPQGDNIPGWPADGCRGGGIWDSPGLPKLVLNILRANLCATACPKLCAKDARIAHDSVREVVCEGCANRARHFIAFKVGCIKTSRTIRAPFAHNFAHSTAHAMGHFHTPRQKQ